MSAEVDNNLIENNGNNNNAKLSVFSELNGASIGVGIGLICVIIASLVFYVFMNLSPKKSVKVVDDADLFTSGELDDITDAAKDLSRLKDINVVVVTTRDKGRGYSNSDEDEKRFAEDFYMDHVKTVPLQNNSGICILIDVTLDEPGQRFFWLYTYGTAHFAVDDDDCYSLFRSYITELGDGEYGTAVHGILGKLKGFSYTNYAPIVFFTILIPVGLALAFTAIISPKRRLDKAPSVIAYSGDHTNVIEKFDKFKHKSVTRMSSDSGGGGGFSGGGGGGGFSGGGGGGFSGGGGGRF
ncbi:MAG: TPM domain-containing protein [Saccharofermentans sp.]|nr:TPM domain-containing protein [Saccharofermentans sp.]